MITEFRRVIAVRCSARPAFAGHRISSVDNATTTAATVYFAAYPRCGALAYLLRPKKTPLAYSHFPTQVGRVLQTVK